MTGNGQLTRGALIINDFLRNPHFSDLVFFEDGAKLKIPSEIFLALLYFPIL